MNIEKFRYVDAKIIEDELAPIKETMYDLIIKAQKEAFRRGIEANSIVINENMVKVTEFSLPTFRSLVMTSPMICGLNVYWTKDELPDNYSFALVNDNRKNRLAEFESIGMEPEELKKAAELYKLVKEQIVDV